MFYIAFTFPILWVQDALVSYVLKLCHSLTNALAEPVKMN